MKMSLSLTIAAGIAVLGLMIHVSTSSNLPPESNQLSSDYDKFGTQFSMAVLRSKPSDNIVCSPIGIALLLSAIMHGARGRTKQELKSALNLYAYDDQRIIFSARNLIQFYESFIASNTKLIMINRMYLPKGQVPSMGFSRYIMEPLKIESSQLDNQVVGSTHWSASVNWSPLNQFNIFQSFMHRGEMAEDAAFLANAFYFKGQWLKPFNHLNYTRFHGSQQRVPMMTQVDEFRHGVIPEFGAKFIELPFKDRVGSMIILIPTSFAGLEGIESNLHLFKDLSTLHEKTGLVEISLPIFNVSSSILVKNQLSMLGINDMFQSTADLSDILRLQQFKFNDVLQNVVLEVDDAIDHRPDLTNLNGQYPHHVERFMVDEPFIVLIASGNAVLIAAKVIQPQV